MPHIEANDNKFEAAKIQLDRFWHEIFWRRENEQKIIVWSVGFFAAILALVYGSESDLKLVQKLILTSLPVILGLLSSWYLFQNWRKDKEIAHLIVKLNEALGAWEPGYFVPDQPLYPEKWRQWGHDPSLNKWQFFTKFRRDKVSFGYFCLVIASTVICVLGILAK